MLNRVFLLLLTLPLLALLAWYLWYFVAHIAAILAFGYPLDYGEGPLLAQVQQLRADISIWSLYADPAQAPFLIVNYPPLFLLLSAALATLNDNILLSGRLISTVSALSAGIALFFLVLPSKPRSVLAYITATLAALYWLSVPIVREWAALMRVDLLGICLGLWGLWVLGSRTENQELRTSKQRERSFFRASDIAPMLAGLLLLLSLFTKPSLIAAPAAATLWLGLRAWRGTPASRAMARRELLILLGVLLLGGGALFALLQSASGGWFALHVVAANANAWQLELAWAFWQQQLRLRWPLLLAAALIGGLCFLPGRRQLARVLTLPALYTLFATIVALGVGKVGAYSNYFLELYAGLIWLVGAGILAEFRIQNAECRSSSAVSTNTGVVDTGISNHISLVTFFAPLSIGLLVVSLLYYPPLWDSQELRPAGVTAPNPPRLAVGNYGLHRDLARQDKVLAALTRVQGALASEVQASTTPIFTDLPGVAASNAVSARTQVFEYRQLLDQGQADQRALLAELANGALDLAVLDSLGNWLTPETQAILKHRYAQDGALGTFNLFRPLALGPATSQNLQLNEAIMLTGAALALPPGETYEAGALLPIALELSANCSQASAACANDGEITVIVLDTDGSVLTDTTQPLLYGVFPPTEWPRGTSIQHIAVPQLPEDLLPGRYDLHIALDGSDGQRFAMIDILPQGGSFFPETGYFVPGAIRRAWSELGGVERAGLPLSPAVPFAWGTLQCFERSCLELRDGQVNQRPLGEQLYLAETQRSEQCLPAAETAQGSFRSGRVPATLCDEFIPFWRDIAATAGEPISGSLDRQQLRVQWTQYARIERHSDDSFSLGRLGDETLRLAPGERYRWP
jgi:hypothetical protein